MEAGIPDTPSVVFRLVGCVKHLIPKLPLLIQFPIPQKRFDPWKELVRYSFGFRCQLGIGNGKAGQFVEHFPSPMLFGSDFVPTFGAGPLAFTYYGISGRMHALSYLTLGR